MDRKWSELLTLSDCIFHFVSESHVEAIRGTVWDKSWAASSKIQLLGTLVGGNGEELKIIKE